MTLHEAFEAWARRRPDAIAVTYGERSLSYGELDASAERLAGHLRARGVGRDQRVGLCLEPSDDLLIGILGILKAGGAYLPLDPELPAERLASMQREAGARIVVTREGLHGGLEGAVDVASIPEDAEDFERTGSADDLAYVIYTSGSTGRPKGVMIPHGNVLGLFASVRAELDFREDDVGALFHSFAFDFSVAEIWGALLFGGRLVVVPTSVRRSPDALFALLCRERVTLLNHTPLALVALMEAETRSDARLHLRRVQIGGDRVRLAALRPWFERHGADDPEVFNLYGPTETTVWVTQHRVTMDDVRADRGAVIGRAQPGAEIRLLAPGLVPVAPGEPGEIWVGGERLARGYLERPDLTAERFVDTPGGRLYRTGDLGRWLPDGDLEFLGRADRQVKVRGYRVEPGEIEAALATHPAVRACAVTLREDAAGEPRLVAYVVGDAVPADVLRARLGRTLPAHMVPARFVWIDALPLTSNGKLDERALPPPDRARPDLGVPYVPPRTALEGELVALWSDLLAIAPVGVHDSFFDLGGDSLSAAWLAARLRRKPGVEVAVQALLAAPTVAELARMIEERPAELPVVADVASPVPDLDALRAANDHLHRTLLAAPVVDASDAGTHPSWYLAHDMRMAVMVRVAFGNASVAAISAAFSSLLVAQPLLRSVLERRGDETLFVEHAAVPVGALPVIDGEIGGIEAAMRRWMAEGAMDGRILFRVALVRAGDGVTLLLCLDHAVADHDCAWIVERQLRAALAGAPVGGGPTWRTFVEATRPSRSIGAIAAFKVHFRRYLDAVGALQARFPVGAPIVGSAPLHLEHESPENLAADVALWLAVQACRIQLGVEELPLRVLTSRRRFGRSLYYETLGDFHDSLPVMFDRPDLSGCNAQLRAVRAELASSGVYPSAMGRDPEVYERFFMSPANFNHLGEVSAGQERELLATAGPLSFVSYPVLAWSRGDRASVLLLHGLSPDGRTVLEAGIGRIGGSFRIRALA